MRLHVSLRNQPPTTWEQGRMLRSGVRRITVVLLMSYSTVILAASFALFSSNIMAALAFRPAASLVRRSNSFRAAATTTRLQLSSSSSSSGGLGLDIKPPLPATTTAGWGRQGELRRRRAKPDSNSLAKLVSHLPGYQEGTVTTTTTTLHSTTTNDTENNMVDSLINGGSSEREEEEYYLKFFPNIGKNVLELPPRMRYVVEY